MNLRDLEYVVAVADHMHFGKAADACFVSQPTLSTQIRKLEDELGVTLFERTNKKVMITPTGEDILIRVRGVLQQVNEIDATAKALRDPFAGELRMGIFPTLAPYLLPRIIPSITKKFPKLKLFLIEEKTERICAQLKNGSLDAILVSLPNDNDGLEFTRLFDEAFLLAVPSSHPLSNNTSIQQSELKDQNILLLEDGHCFRDQALEICSSQGAIENQGFRATSLETLRHMVATNVGITLIPELAIPDRDSIIRYIPFSSPHPKRTIGMAWRISSCRKKMFKEIAKLIRICKNRE